MTKNVGGIDRIARIVLGFALLVGFFLNDEGTYRWLYLLGLPILLTGVFQTCFAYKLLGFNTCPVKNTK